MAVEFKNTKYYNLKEISEYLSDGLVNIHVTKLREYIRLGKLKSTKIGRTYIVSEDNIIDFLENRDINNS